MEPDAVAKVPKGTAYELAESREQFEIVRFNLMSKNKQGKGKSAPRESV